MKTIIEEISEKASRVVKHWWLMLVAGVLSVAAGIMVFCKPAGSYMTLSIMFGVLMLVTGVAGLVTSLTSRNYFMTRGYNVVGGVLDMVLGFFLCLKPQITLVMLPVFLGIWMMFHSFMVIGFGGDLNGLRLRGSGWVIAEGVLLLVLSLLIMMNPFSFGIASVIVLTGVGLLLFGAMLIFGSLKLRHIHRWFTSGFDTVDEQ